MTSAKSTQRSTVVGVFHSREAAESAVTELEHSGFGDDEIGFVGKTSDGMVVTKEDQVDTGIAAGAAIGAGAAALASLGITFGMIPVIGPIVATGPLMAALLSAVGGAVAGGLVGALVGLGIPEHEAKYYEAELQSGRFLVTVKTDNRHDEAWRILQRMGAYNHGSMANTSPTFTITTPDQGPPVTF